MTNMQCKTMCSKLIWGIRTHRIGPQPGQYIEAYVHNTISVIAPTLLAGMWIIKIQMSPNHSKPMILNILT